MAKVFLRDLSDDEKKSFWRSWKLNLTKTEFNKLVKALAYGRDIAVGEYFDNWALEKIAKQLGEGI